MIIKRRSYSLIELLVTLAIVSLLIALTSGGIRRIRCNSVATTCMSNIRQLGLAIVMYEQDYDALPGSLSRLDHYTRPVYAREKKEKFFFTKPAHAESPRLGPYYQNYYTDPDEALQKVKLLHCPVVPGGQISYGLNENVAGKSMKSITNKSCIMMSDSTAVLIHNVADLSFRHCSENVANVLFVDMTLGSLSKEKVTPYNLMEEGLDGISEPIIVEGTWGYWLGGFFDEPHAVSGRAVHESSFPDVISDMGALTRNDGPSQDEYGISPPEPIERFIYDEDVNWSSPPWSDPEYNAIIHILARWEWVKTSSAPWELPPPE